MRTSARRSSQPARTMSGGVAENWVPAHVQDAVADAKEQEAEEAALAGRARADGGQRAARGRRRQQDRAAMTTTAVADASRHPQREPGLKTKPMLQSSLDWSSALAALEGTDRRGYSARPLSLSASSSRQIFVERPPARRLGGGDKWRNSGGKAGCTDHWVGDLLGMRKRYGRVMREGGLAPLKFMQFSLLRRQGIDDESEYEDRSAILYAVEGTEDEPERTVEATAPDSTASIDVSLGRTADAFREMPRKIRGGDTGSCTEIWQGVDTRGNDGTAIDVAKALLAKPQLFRTQAVLPTRAADSNHSETLDTWDDASDPTGANDWASRFFKGASGSEAESASTETSAENSNVSTGSTESTDGASNFLGFDGLDFAAFDSDWDSSTSSDSPPPLSVTDLENIYSGSGQQRLAWPWQLDPVTQQAPSEPSVRKTKRKMLMVESLQYGATKKTCVGHTAAAAAAGLGLITILAATLLHSSKSDVPFNGDGTGVVPSKADSTGMCEKGPVSISGAVPGLLCSAAPEGSICPYDCPFGFRRDGHHTCTRKLLGHFGYSGGSCVPLDPCLEGASLVDNGSLQLRLDGPFRQCTWELFCSNEALSPILTFSVFQIVHGNLSIHNGSPHDAEHEKLQVESQSDKSLENNGAFVSRRLGYRRRSKLPPRDVTMLHGIDPWWISQPIGVSQPSAVVIYSSELTGRDMFAATFTCGAFVEHCTASDKMELDWVTLQHPDRHAMTELSEELSIPPTIAESIWHWDPPLGGASDCTSEPCVRGVCIDSSSSHGAYSSLTAFTFVCDCQPGWSGELCDVPPGPDFQFCTPVEDDCNAAVSSCVSVGPGQHECSCFPGYAPSSVTTCELRIENPPVGRAWQSGPGYEASEYIVRGTFNARIGESMQTSNLHQRRFFDPASYNQVLIAAPLWLTDGCSIDDYNQSTYESNRVMLLPSGNCDYWVKVLNAQLAGAAGVIIHGDFIPETIAWSVDNPELIDPTYAGKTAEQVGLKIEIPAIIMGESQGRILQSALLSGPTWVDLHCGHTQHLSGNGLLPPPPPLPPPDSDVCASSPCLNGASCASGADPHSFHRSGTQYALSEYTCTCRPGFVGEHCDFSAPRPPPGPLPQPPTCQDDALWRSLDNGYDCTSYRGASQKWCSDWGTIRQSSESGAGNESARSHAYDACPLSCGVCA